jgi:hypothetical protein
MPSWLRRLLASFHFTAPAAAPSHPNFATESYYHVLALEELLRSHAIALPPKPRQCYTAHCDRQATWWAGQDGAWLYADYCDLHVAAARKRLADYGLRWTALPATSYFQEHCAAKIIVLRPTGS